MVEIVGYNVQKRVKVLDKELNRTVYKHNNNSNLLCIIKSVIYNCNFGKHYN